MDAILTDSHLDTRIKICILMNAIVPKLEYAGQVWEGKAKLVKQLETVHTTAAKKVLLIGNGVTANVKKWAAVVCNEDKLNPVTFKY